MFVFDTSAFVNGQRDHLPPETFPSVWEFIAGQIRARKILVPRMVYREIETGADEISEWIKQFAGFVIDADEPTQREVGVIAQHFPQNTLRHEADPFIIAEAKRRGLTVVTYEGRTFRGVPSAEKRWHRSMPGICGRLGVGCCTLPEALTRLGARL